MSGRRSSKRRRQPGRDDRHLGGDIARRDRQLGGRLADQHRDGVLELGAGHPDRDRLRLGAAQLRLGLRDVRRRGDPGVVLIAGDAQRLGIILRGRFEQTLQLVGNAQLQIGAGERPLRRQAGAGEVAGARLGARDIALDGAAHPPPEVRRPARRRRRC